MVKSITWQQVAVVGMMLAFAFAAHMFLGQSAGMAVGGAATLVAFMLGRPRDGGAS